MSAAIRSVRGTRGTRGSARLAVATVLYAAAVVSTWLGSADPPLDLRSSAHWYRVLSRVPGPLGACGDFTWGARSLPPLLALLGAVIVFVPNLVHR